MTQNNRVEFADQVPGDYFMLIGSRTTLANALHQCGRTVEALQPFRESESAQAQHQPYYPLLYTLQGFRYCDLLLAELERVAWATLLGFALRFLQSGGSPRINRRCFARSSSGRHCLSSRARRRRRRSFDIALDHLTLGRVALTRPCWRTRLVTLPTRAPGPDRIAQLTASRPATHCRCRRPPRLRQLKHFPRGLLTRAWLRFMEGDPEGAKADLDEAWEIAERGSMKLHMADILLHRARLFHDRAALEAAARLIKETGYHRRDDELRDAQEAAQHWPQQPDDPRTPEADSSDPSGIATLDAERGSTQDSPAAAQEKPMPEPNAPKAPKPVFISYARNDGSGAGRGAPHPEPERGTGPVVILTARQLLGVFVLCAILGATTFPVSRVVGSVFLSLAVALALFGFLGGVAHVENRWGKFGGSAAGFVATLLILLEFGALPIETVDIKGMVYVDGQPATKGVVILLETSFSDNRRKISEGNPGLFEFRGVPGIGDKVKVRIDVDKPVDLNPGVSEHPIKAGKLIEINLASPRALAPVPEPRPATLAPMLAMAPEPLGEKFVGRTKELAELTRHGRASGIGTNPAQRIVAVENR